MGLGSNQQVAGLALQASRTPGASSILTPVPWTDLVVGGGWTTDPAYPLRYRLLADGTVELRGRVTGGAVPAAIATLPVGTRPPVDFHTVCGSSDSTGPTYGAGAFQLLSATGVLQGETVEAGAGAKTLDFTGVSWSIF